MALPLLDRLATLTIAIASVLAIDVGVVATRWADSDEVAAAQPALTPTPTPSESPSAVPSPSPSPSVSPSPVKPSPSPTPTPPAPPSLAGSILFESRSAPSRGPNPDGTVTPGAQGYNVWVMDLGGGRKRLLTKSGFDANPALAPDGRSVAWLRRNNQVWTMRTDGTGARQVGSCPLSCNNVAWSPNGKRLAYTTNSGGAENRSDIVTIDADGSHPRRFNTTLDEYAVDWSPDGTRFAVVVTQGGDRGNGVYVMNVGSGATTHIHTGNAGSPDWSPDGKLILFSDNNDLFTIRPDGSGLRMLTGPPSRTGQFTAGAWSRDGKLIAFGFYSGVPGRRGQIGTMLANGTRHRLLTDPTADSSSPAC